MSHHVIPHRGIKGYFCIGENCDLDRKTTKTPLMPFLLFLSYKKPRPSELGVALCHPRAVGASVLGECSTIPFVVAGVAVYSEWGVTPYYVFSLLLHVPL